MSSRDKDTIVSATANSGFSAMSSGAYSPTQKTDAGKAVNESARSARNERKVSASAYVASARKESIEIMLGRRDLTSAEIRSTTASRPPARTSGPSAS